MLIITIARILLTIVVTRVVKMAYEAVVCPNKEYEQFYAAHHKNKEDE